MRSTGAWRRRDRRIRRPAERPCRLTRCGAGRIWTRRVRAGRIRVGRVGPGWHRAVRMTGRSVRLGVGVRTRVVRTGMVMVRIGRWYSPAGRNRAARAPRCGPPPRRRSQRGVRGRRVRARRCRPGRCRTVHGGRRLRSGPAVRSAAALLRDRGATGARRQRRLRTSPGILPSGRTTLVLVVGGIARRDPLPGHCRDTRPGRRGGAGAFVTLVAAHAASPRP
jgi:hypothetical protein